LCTVQSDKKQEFVKYRRTTYSWIKQRKLSELTWLVCGKEREREYSSGSCVVADCWRQDTAESVAALPPFSPIEGQKWFDQISSQWESQKNRFALIYFGKIQFFPPCIWNLPFMSTASGLAGKQQINKSLQLCSQYWAIFFSQLRKQEEFSFHGRRNTA
jgi:hypothetical protein